MKPDWDKLATEYEGSEKVLAGKLSESLQNFANIGNILQTFGGLVLDYIKADFCDQMESSRRDLHVSIHCTPFYSSQIATFFGGGGLSSTVEYKKT